MNMNNGWKTTKQIESWMNHCLESDYSSTMVQIAIADRSPRLTQYPWTHVLRSQEFRVCSKNA